MSAPQTFLSLDHIRPTAREVFRGLLRAIENEPRPLLSLIYAMPRPERLGGQRTPRPPNTFLLFKSWISKAFGSEEAGIAEELWWELKLANSSIIACFTSMQLEAKEKHLQVFPDYKYLRRKKKKDTNGNQDGDGEASSCGMRADASYNGQVQPNADLYYTHNAVYQTTSSSSSVSASYASSASQHIAFPDNIPNTLTPHMNAAPVTNPWPPATFNASLDIMEPFPESSFSSAPVLRYSIFPGEESLMYSPGLSPVIDSPATESSTASYGLTDPLELASWPPTLGAGALSVSDYFSLPQYPSAGTRDRLLAHRDESWDMNVFKPDIYNPELDFQYNSFFALPDNYGEDFELGPVPSSSSSVNPGTSFTSFIAYPGFSTENC